MFIVVGVTGGIAAYKTVQLVRLLVKDGHDVHVVPTDDALRFVGMPTWEAISRNTVTTSVHDDVAQVRHVALGQQADLVVVAPATANTIAKMAAGLADDLLGTTLLATTAPVLIAPAMHTEMWRHPATQANIDTLTSRGVHMIGPVSGELTGGDSGPGRVSEPEDIYAAIRRELEQGAPGSAAAAGTRWLVTAGGTREPLDPVRYIGNRSSGRQGLEVARAAAARGADVTLVAVNMDPGLVRMTPETLPGAAEGSYASHESGIRILTASSTEELRDVVREEADQHDVVVMAAAVSDYRAADVAQDKMRKEDTGGALSIELVETPDILAEIAASRREGQTIVGFAAETPGEKTLAERAFAKRERKGCDLLAANEVGWDRGFERDDNHLLVVDEMGIVADVAGTKRETAEGLVTAILAR
ncbi:phosphopantothenoylcysteine decarboxylase [Microbacterium faecale]|uniref:Coenzyme A biosynthesis bifunctional protein CoaBC n=1 Tax=Microbacterium faecale TaxID=1804630 RepID=A0A916YI36_9MICO|nr:bifunctional phosphopantothenoylcysteine decarboxylase/phosphopantothenate--cysteine ligase CoaBC [Microbacterium faecale]GGD46058.1 phosphopantothenoylcysteine decarboxylase [Microbacterium faecale]